MIYGGYFDVDCKLERIKELEKTMIANDFWDNKENADKVIRELGSLKDLTAGVVECKKRLIGDNEVFLLLENEYDEELMGSLESEIIDVEQVVSDLEMLLLLSGPHDKNNCILEVHSGAGGTEACDWAMMLYRMYIRWFERRNYKYEVLDVQDGEEAGIKSASILVKGIYAYGYLKNEKGIHRLVRLSPFDSNNKRHTSFASIDVTPEFDNTIDISISDSDIKIDVYRSSGAGGQSVNTTDSAVRITHLPTKIVVTCQNERSQIQNREKAMQMLKNKLKFMEIEKHNEELAKVKGTHMEINFGSQIRSYVMHPYSMVKDLRTDVETSNVNKVLDGDIDLFIESNLKGVNNEN